MYYNDQFFFYLIFFIAIYEKFIEKFSSLAHSNEDPAFEKQIKTAKKPQRLEKLLGNTSNSLSAQKETGPDQKKFNILKENLKTLICDLMEFSFKIPFETFLEEKKEFCIFHSNFLETEKKIAPDVFGDFFKTLTDESLNDESDTIHIFKLLLQYGREIDVNSEFKEFKKFFEAKYGESMEKIRVAFFYAINELKFMGFINYRKKKKMTLNKYFFAKNLYFDYNKK